jgi:hypothetical protein
MTSTCSNFRDGATAFKNSRDLTAEYRSTAIAYANEIAGQIIESEDDEDAGEDDERDDQEVDAASSVIQF